MIKEGLEPLFDHRGDQIHFSEFGRNSSVNQHNMEVLDQASSPPAIFAILRDIVRSNVYLVLEPQR